MIQHALICRLFLNACKGFFCLPLNFFNCSTLNLHIASKQLKWRIVDSLLPINMFWWLIKISKYKGGYFTSNVNANGSTSMRKSIWSTTFRSNESVTDLAAKELDRQFSIHNQHDKQIVQYQVQSLYFPEKMTIPTKVVSKS